MERLICLAIGYVCGLFQTGYIVGEMSHVDIRKKGSGNAGTTNALRVLGWKAGLLTFSGDVLKCVAAFLIVFFMYRGSDYRPLLTLYAGAGVTLGHNFPFYMNFKGGKGIAVMAGLVAVNSFWHLPASLALIPVTLASFLIPVVMTRYISVGSLAAYTVFLIEMVLIGQWGWFDMESIRCYELYIVLFLMTVLAWYRHRENLKRLLNGTENKFGSKKKEE
ncbi:MAG TPA: glycerol-3-phosphate 1-O-acyltransferase PlsY [Candidatus Mediterraneibacter pullistercoris]|nr:glycerol-3-phosphate 1-O-acyltransferase PlsY [Candidatus Mediterraneibacter pullistercoris]